jgi:ribosomal protein S12 methylthiotransferase accessory factor
MSQAWARIGGRLGLLGRCRIAGAPAGAPATFVAENQFADVSVLGAPLENSSGGIGTTLTAALLSAIGEAVERYCAALYDPATFAVGGAAQFPEAVGPDEFRFFSPSQHLVQGFPLAPWTSETVLGWVPGRSLASGDRRLLPACVVFVPYAGAGEAEIFRGVSTGQACHPDRAQALLTGLLEVVERDACMIVWLRGLPVTRLRFEDDPQLSAFHQQYLARPGFTYQAFDVTSELGLPAVIAVAEGPGPHGATFGVGSACKTSEPEAIEKALLEAYHTYLFSNDALAEQPDWRPAGDWSNVVRFRDHVRLCALPGARERLAMLLGSTRERPVRRGAVCAGGTPERLAFCVRRVTEAGLDPIAVDLTTRDVADLGLHVLKVVVPGMVPLTAAAPAGGSPRLRTVPRTLGHTIPDTQWNQIPHPFP